MTALGVYVGNDPAALAKYASWLGSTPDYVHGVVGFSTWNDFVYSAAWQANLWKNSGADVQWSVPLISNAGNLATAATGAYNHYYKQVAESILKGNAGTDPIMVRVGWEANGNWFAWSAVGKEEAFKGAFHEFVDTFREVSGRFVFEWNISHMSGGVDPATIYPGDDYVDIIGMDFYFKPEYYGSDPARAFNFIKNDVYGLNWLENFAAAHNKPTSYSEWGATGPNSGAFVQLAKQWFDTHNVVLQSYWDSDADYAGKLSDGSDAGTGNAYKAAFKGSGSGEVSWSDVSIEQPTPVPEVPVVTPPVVTPPVVTPPVATAPTPTVIPSASLASRNTVAGTSKAEKLVGTNGHDAIAGSGGDTLEGGAGDDTYTVLAGDVVIEAAGKGTDTVRTWLGSYTLPDNVENLVITGASWTIATGNELANRITGNASPNTLNGRGGNDYLTGGGGGDTFVVARGEGNDVIADFRGGEGDVIRLDGFAFKDFAAVKAASVQSGADVVIGLGGGQVLKLLGVSLPGLDANDFSLVNIVPTPPPPPPSSGAPSTWFAGTSAAETLNGTAGNDIMTGSGGDTLKGGAGDDTYDLNSVNDKVVELAGGGIDTVRTWLGNYTLPDNVENLTITGSSWSTVAGNELANRIIGNDSPNTIDGKGGNDHLTGGGGNDTFIISKGEGHDVVTDFEGAGKAGGDTLLLKGFGAGTTITNLVDDTFAIRAADGSVTHVTLTGVKALAAGDYAFA